MAEISNKLNIRVRGVNNDKIMQRIKHNIRHIKSKSHINNNNNVFIDLGTNASYEFLSYKNSLSHRMYKDFSTKYKIDRVEHNKRHMQCHQRSARNYHSSWAEGVLTFSPVINQNLENGVLTQKELIETAKNMLKEFESKWDTKIEMLVLHVDESTPHFHFLFRNYDSRGMSITHKHRKREKLSELQDLMFKYFKHLGMERGTKKPDIDCGVYEYNNPQQVEVSTLKNEIKELKTFRKSITEDIDLAIEDKKKIYSEITEAQKKLREKLKTVNELKIKGTNLVKKVQNVKNKLNDNMTIEAAQKILKNNFNYQNEHLKVKKLEQVIALKDTQLKEQLTDLKDYEISLQREEKTVKVKTNEVKALEFSLKQEKGVIATLTHKLNKLREQVDLKGIS